MITTLSNYSKPYEKFILLDDFDMINRKVKEKNAHKYICLENLIKEPFCDKSNTSFSINLIPANQRFTHEIKHKVACLVFIN